VLHSLLQRYLLRQLQAVRASHLRLRRVNELLRLHLHARRRILLYPEIARRLLKLRMQRRQLLLLLSLVPASLLLPFLLKLHSCPPSPYRLRCCCR